MHIGLKYQGMELVTMMFGKSIPIIGFPIREGTVELSLVQLIRDYNWKQFNWNNEEEMFNKQARAELGQAQP